MLLDEDHSCFHYLVPVEGSESESPVEEWQGRVMAFERTIKSEAQKNAEGFKEQHAILEGKIDGLEERMNRMEGSTSKLETSSSRLEAAVDQILQKLDGNGPSLT